MNNKGILGSPICQVETIGMPRTLGPEIMCGNTTRKSVEFCEGERTPRLNCRNFCILIPESRVNGDLRQFKNYFAIYDILVCCW